MGYKGTMRSLNAAAKRAAKAEQQHNRAVTKEAERGLRRLDASSERALKLAHDFEQAVIADPIKALDLRYFEHQGLASTPFQIQTDAIRGTIYVLDPRQPHPPLILFEGPTCRITLLDFRIAFFGTVLAFRIDNLHSTHRLKLGWFKKSQPGESPVFLVDDVNAQYYYPKASDLVGEVVPGQSRVGLMVFDPFRMPTGSAQIHFSGVVVGPSKESATLSFAYRPESLGHEIHGVLSAPPFVERVRAQVEASAQGQASAIQQAASQAMIKKKSGCLGCALAVAPVLAVPIGLAAWWALT